MSKIKRKVVYKFYGEDLVAGLDIGSMKELGVADEDWLFIENGITGRKAARLVVKEDRELEGKNEIGISEKISEASGFSEGLNVSVIKHYSWQ